MDMQYVHYFWDTIFLVRHAFGFFLGGGGGGGEFPTRKCICTVSYAKKVLHLSDSMSHYKYTFN
jgi:hypothetical protein